jgi:hypothetical protein
MLFCVFIAAPVFLLIYNSVYYSQELVWRAGAKVEEVVGK